MTTDLSTIASLKSLINGYEEWALETGLNPNYNPCSNWETREIAIINEEKIKKNYISLDDLFALWDKTKDLDINSMIKQSQYKGGFGKLINFIIIGLHHFLMKIGKVHAANNIIFAQNLPYRGLARMSGGMMDMAMLDGVILMSNGHFFKGSKVYMKSYFSKKKEERRKRKL